MMDEIDRALTAQMTQRFGTPITVRWSFRLFQLTCTRDDGVALTDHMRDVFQQLLRERQPRPVAFVTAAVLAGKDSRRTGRVLAVGELS